MIPGNVDPRRAEKVQRYKPPAANGNTAPVEDLTPDYMNILGPDSATANADSIEKSSAADQQEDPVQHHVATATQPPTNSNGTNVIPTSPQYGVAIISAAAATAAPTAGSGNDVPNETTTTSVDSVVDTTAKTNLVDDGKDMHSTPSRNDRFKVVKIASLEPFRRGRWKCMDYVDENPPATTQQNTKQTQSATNIQQVGGSVQYLQTQSLPQQHFQQLLVQGAFSGSPQGFYQNVPNAMIPQSQYFYPAQTAVNMQQVPVQQNNLQPATFINTGSQPFFPANVTPHSGASYTTYSTNVQYVPPNLIQTQSSAFVPTSQHNPQLPANFQQSQTYAGPPSTQQPPMVNGHAFPNTSEQPQVVASSLPTQIAKNIILQPAIVSTNQGLVNANSVSGAQNVNQQYTQSYNPPTNPPAITQVTHVTQGTQGTMVTQVPVIPLVNPITHSTPASSTSFNQINFSQIPPGHTQYELTMPATNAVYTNPQFVATESNSNDGHGDGGIAMDPGQNAENTENPTGEDPAKANPVVNAIDNKIEQAMDLVKSHLMYTVREEVEVLKEKIVELMDRIQQLETENTYLKQQVSKGVGGASAPGNGTPTPAPPSVETQSVPVVPTAPGATSGANPAAPQQQQQQ